MNGMHGQYDGERRNEPIARMRRRSLQVEHISLLLRGGPYNEDTALVSVQFGGSLEFTANGYRGYYTNTGLWVPTT